MSDDFRQLGVDLAAFAPSPEAQLGVPKAMPFNDEERAQHYWETNRWYITRTRYVSDWLSVTYEWRPIHATRATLRNSLRAALNQDRIVDKLMLGYQMDGISYDVIYDIREGAVQQIRFMSRTTGVSGQYPHAESPVPFEYVLRRVPTDMTPSFTRTELASV